MRPMKARTATKSSWKTTRIEIHVSDPAPFPFVPSCLSTQTRCAIPFQANKHNPRCSPAAQVTSCAHTCVFEALCLCDSIARQPR